jgi:hypothetical protein
MIPNPYSYERTRSAAEKAYNQLKRKWNTRSFAGLALERLFFLWISGALSVNACITPLVTPIWESPQLPDIQDIALMATVSQALESGEEDESSAGILNFPNNLKELQPSARGRFRSRIHKIDLRDLSSWMEKSQRNLLSDSIYQ